MIKVSNLRILLSLFAFILLELSARGYSEYTSFSKGKAVEKVITGKITSEAGEALPGVSVVVKGTTTGTVSDVNGMYSITVPDVAEILVFSYVGYIPEEVEIGNKTTINIMLSEDIKSLGEVVVIGYGTQKKSDLTGSVSSVKSEELKAVPATSLDQALQGRAAGVQVTQLSGKPGAETSIRIRGTSSILAGNEPLYVIDGMLVSSDGGDMSTGVNLGPRIGALASINPSDIESIEILKDASATAIYGSRGTNGVVLITTKRGRAGKANISFESYYGIQQISNKVEVLNAEQFGNLVNEANINANETPKYVNPKNLGAGTDWQEELFRTAPIANYQLSASGGDAKTRYAISGGYFTQEGIILSSDFKRYSFRANLDRDLSKRLTIGTSLSLAHISSTGILTNAGTIVPGVVTSALLFYPTNKVYDPNGPGGYTYENDEFGRALGNPVAEAKEFNSFGTTSRVLGNVYANYEIIEGLEFKTSLGVDGFASKERAFGPNFLRRTKASKGEVSIGAIQGLTWLNENTLTFNKTINEKHNINAVVGYTLQEFKNESLLAYSFDFLDNRTGYHNIGAGVNPQKPANSESQWNMVSYLGRVNYGLNDKYLFTVTGRVDGSSKFAKGNKYGFFPSGAVAWKVSNEEFMKDINFFSDLKLRASYGVLGNQAIPPYSSLPAVGSIGEGVFNGSDVYTGKEPLLYANEDLKWESTRQLDLGLDASFFNHRISVTADYYHKKTYDLLLDTPIPNTSGFSSTVLNVGNVENKGFDLDIRTVNTKGKLQWNSSINFSINRNKITNLNSDEDIPVSMGGGILRVGQPIGTFYGYIFDGIFQTDEEASNSPVLKGQEATAPYAPSHAKAGDRKYRDISGDGVIDEQDRTVIGSVQADFTWGFNNTLSYKGLELSFFIQGSQGNELANFNLFDLQNFNGQNNVMAEAALNRWTPANPSNKYPRALASGNLDQGIFSSNIVEDASYVRLKNITLGYNLPSSFLENIKVSSLRIYVSGTNLVTLTKYSGYDPEANTYGQNSTLIGVDNGGYPMSKTYLVGLNIGF